MHRRGLSTIASATMDSADGIIKEHKVIDGAVAATQGTPEAEFTAVSAERPRGARTREVNRAPAARGVEDRHLAVPSDSRWHSIAPRVSERVTLKDAGRDDVAQILYLSYERTMTNREIGRYLDMSHHTVGKIQTAGAQVLREEQDKVPIAS